MNFLGAFGDLGERILGGARSDIFTPQGMGVDRYTPVILMKKRVSSDLKTAGMVVGCVMLTLVPVVWRVADETSPSGALLFGLAGLPVLSLVLIADLDRVLKHRALRIFVLLLGALDVMVALSVFVVI